MTAIRGKPIRTILLIGVGMAVLAGVGRWRGISRDSLASAVSVEDQAKPDPDLVIHEWGTFLGMSGSDGSALDGMYHEEHAAAVVCAREEPRSAPASLDSSEG